MKSPSLVTEVVNPAIPEVAPLNVPDLPSQRGKVRKFASFGSKVDVIEELIAKSFMRVRLVSQDKLLLPVRQVVIVRIKRSNSKNKKKYAKNPKRKGSRSSSRSKSPKSPKSPKSKGSGKSSSKPSPAAVCLVASMLASVSQAICIPQPRVFCPSIRFDDSPDVSLVKARGNLRPIGNSVTRGKVTFPWGHKFDVDQLAVSDAALTGTMLAGSVSNCLQGVECKCAYLCDTDFGCKECIPKGIKAMDIFVYSSPELGRWVECLQWQGLKEECQK